MKHRTIHGVLALIVGLLTLSVSAGTSLAGHNSNHDDRKNTSASIEFDKDPAVIGDEVTVTAKVFGPAPGKAPVTVGELTIQQKTGPNTWDDVAGPTTLSGTNTITYAFDTTGYAPGNEQFRAVYSGYGSTSDADGFKPATSPPANLKLQIVCNSFTLTNDLSSGAGEPIQGSGLQEWTFRLRANNCTENTLSNLKIQGGTNGWGQIVGDPVVSTGPDTVAVKTNKRNEVLTWGGFNLAPGASETMTVTLSGSIGNEPCFDEASFDEDDPTTHPEAFAKSLTGQYSATYSYVDEFGATVRMKDLDALAAPVTVIVTCPSAE